MRMAYDLLPDTNTFDKKEIIHARLTKSSCTVKFQWKFDNKKTLQEESKYRHVPRKTIEQQGKGRKN